MTNSTSSQKAFSAAMVVGAILVGVVLFIIGSVLKSHYQFSADVCNTYGGSAGQCAGSMGAVTAAQFLQPIGVILAVLGVIGGVALMILNAKANATTGAVQGSASRSHKAPAYTAPIWVPPLPSQQWVDALSAAAAQPQPLSQQLQAAIQNEPNRDGLRAWMFGTNIQGNTSLILVYTDRIKMTECRDTGQGSISAFPDGDSPIRMSMRRSGNGSASEISIGESRFHELEPAEAVVNFVQVVKQLAWLQTEMEEPAEQSAESPAPIMPLAAPTGGLQRPGGRKAGWQTIGSISQRTGE